MPRVVNIKLIGVIIGLIILALFWYFYNYNSFRNMDEQTIIIKSCSSLEPNRLAVESGKPVRFINKDVINHTIKLAGSLSVVKTGERKELIDEFIYGAGTYAYDCDSAVNAGQIQIVAPEQDLKGTEQTFKEMFDSLPKELRECVKKMLSSKFEKVYNGQEGFVLGASDQEAMNSCLELQQQTPQQ